MNYELKLSDKSQEAIVAEGVEWIVDLWNRRHYACEFLQTGKPHRRHVSVDTDEADSLADAASLLATYTGNWQSGGPRDYDTWGQEFLNNLTDQVRESQDYLGLVDTNPDDTDDLYDEAESVASKLLDVACARADAHIAALMASEKADEVVK